MSKKTNKTEKKKMYCINIMDDYGELWLGHNKEPIEFVHCNDANFREEYQSFIFDYLNVDLICESIYIEDDDLEEKLWDESGDKNAIAKLLKKQIDKLP
jgi:hypothetical protein